MDKLPASRGKAFKDDGPVEGVSWLGDRLTTKRLALIGVIVAVTVAVIAVGDPLSHPGAGEQATGERGLDGVPRIVFFAGLAIAFLIAVPPGEDRGDPDG